MYADNFFLYEDAPIYFKRALIMDKYNWPDYHTLFSLPYGSDSSEQNLQVTSEHPNLNTTTQSRSNSNGNT